VSQAQALVVTSNSETHLDKFSEYNSSHHESIDDFSEDDSHKHTHKHREDGEEHEHEHEHSKIAQADSKVLMQSYKITSQDIEFDSCLIFFDKNLVSSFHPFEIFRPPIA